MKSNRAIIAKAAADTSALGTGGKMNAEQANQFMTFMQDYSPFLNKVNFIRMTKTTRDLDSLDVNKRAMRRQVENGENAPTGTVSPKRRALKAVGVIMPYDITFQFMKENIEGENINTTQSCLPSSLQMTLWIWLSRAMNPVMIISSISMMVG